MLVRNHPPASAMSSEPHRLTPQAPLFPEERVRCRWRAVAFRTPRPEWCGAGGCAPVLDEPGDFERTERAGVPQPDRDVMGLRIPELPPLIRLKRGRLGRE